LRLVPYRNRKLSPEDVPTALVMQSGTRYDLATLLDAFAPPAATTFHDIPGPAPPFVPPPEVEDAGEDRGEGPAAEDLTAERMEELVENTAAVRALLARYIRATFKPGVHFGIIPVAGQETSKPTLLKPGAEMVTIGDGPGSRQYGMARSACSAPGRRPPRSRPGAQDRRVRAPGPAGLPPGYPALP
jgi:hypothetical protein